MSSDQFQTNLQNCRAYAAARRNRITWVGLGLLGVLVTATWCQASIQTFTGSDATGRSAKVTFDNGTAGLLKVTLENLGDDVLVPVDILTALFFKHAGAAGLTPVSAILTAGSTVFFDAQGQPAGGIVGGEWAYGSGFAGPGGATAGISSAGFGLFGAANFPGPDLDPPVAVNGLNYGLTSSNDNTATGNSPVTGGGGNPVPLVKHSIDFILSVAGGGVFDLTGISKVSFQYGTGLSEPRNPGTPGNPPPPGGGVIPEAASLIVWALLIGCGGLAVPRRRRGEAN